MRHLALALLVVLMVPLQGRGAPVAPERALQQITSAEFVSLRSIAGWLRQSGRDGFIGADVADVMGIPRLQTEDLLEARQQIGRASCRERVSNCV